MADFFADNHKKSFNPDFDDSGIKSPQKIGGVEQDNIEEMVNTNNFYTYDETN